MKYTDMAKVDSTTSMTQPQALGSQEVFAWARTATGIFLTKY
jgi:hypothetical protein